MISMMPLNTRTRERVIAVDYSNEDGHCVGSTSYDMAHIPVSTIIRDIKGYFKDYMIPIDNGFALEQENDYERD